MSRANQAEEVAGREGGGAAEWYSRARADVPRLSAVAVDQAEIRYRFWGEATADRANLVLVHGGGAQSAWWDHIGPLLANDRRVAALDLSGHGDSQRRAGYDLRTWAGEIMAVSAASAPGSRPILVAHSMGGAPALYAASAFGPRVSGLILIDPLPHDVTSAETHARTSGKFGKQKVHPSQSAALQRFRVMPEQRTIDYVFAHIAHNSVREVDGGWTWKHDPLIYRVAPGGAWDPGGAVCPIALIHPEHGLSDQAGRAVFGAKVNAGQSVVIPGAAHHVMLDEPLALVTCLRTLLSGPPWSDLR